MELCPRCHGYGVHPQRLNNFIDMVVHENRTHYTKKEANEVISIYAEDAIWN
jgi:Zn-finger nucleic acid-binding protein